MGAKLRPRLAYATTPGPMDLVFARPCESPMRKGMEGCSYVKGDPWESRARGLTGHIAPHSLVSSW